MVKTLKLKKIDQLVVNGKKYHIENLDYDISLLDWIRNKINLKGTKEGCNEGDCGACSVLILEKNKEVPIAINSCLVRLGQMIGKNIITIEGIGRSNNLNEVQKLFVKNNASQCGFCTPGFVVSASTLLYSNKIIKEELIHDTLSGNLCRCTGYAPIINSLKKIKNTKLPCPKYIDIGMNKNIEIGMANYHHPIKLSNLRVLTKKLKKFQFLSGGTDLNLERAVYTSNSTHFICLNNISELKEISFIDNSLKVGSAVSIEKLIEIFDKKLPEVKEILKRFGSPLIRNQATIGGNICTSSPIGDLSPIFMVLETKINTFGLNGERQLLLSRFFKSYRKNVLKKTEVIKNFIIPMPKKGYRLFSWKFSKRYDQDISTLSIAILVKTKNEMIDDIIIAAGGVSEKPEIIHGLSQLMIGKNISLAIKFAIDDIGNYINPITDLRGSSDYRLNVFKGVLRKLSLYLKEKKHPKSIMEFV